MKIICTKCGKIFTVPKGDCVTCFGDELGKLNDIKEKEDRFYALNGFINNLTEYDYQRGLHNAKCVNKLDPETDLFLNFIEYKEKK